MVAQAPTAFGVSLSQVVDECWLTHEAYATFGARSVLEGMRGPRPGLLDRWPRYRAWDELVRAAVSSVHGPQRRYLLATALARVAMQVPLSEILLDVGPAQFEVGMLRSVDRPDGRFRLVLRHDHIMAEAAAKADLAVPEAATIDSEDSDALVVAADEYDELWAHWEHTAYDHLMDWIVEQGGGRLAYNGHQDSTHHLIDLVSTVAGPVRLRAANVSDRPESDLRTVSSILVLVHEDIGDYTARIVEVEVDDVAGLVAEHSRIDDHPVLVLTARLPERLAATYRWQESVINSEHGPPVWGVRLVEPDESGESAIVWIPLTIEAVPRVIDSWGERGTVIAVVAASCLIDAEWQASELAVVRKLVDTLIWVDVPPDRLMTSWTRDDVEPRLQRIIVNDRSGKWHAAVLEAAEADLQWFVVGSETTVGLFRQALGESPAALELANRQLTAFRTAVTTTLAFETTLDFGGVEDRT